MSEVDRELSGRYRATPRDEPPAHLDAAILAAAKRAVGSQPAGVPRRLRRWYVPVSIAAVIMLSVAVTLRMEREQPQVAMPDSVPVLRENANRLAQASETAAPAAAPAAPPPAAASRPARKPAQAQPAAPAFAPDPTPAKDTATTETQRQDSLRASNAASGPAASGELASDARREARAMSAPAPAAAPAKLVKSELAPEEWLGRIADLRKQQRNHEADEQFAEFKRRYPDYRIPEAMTERIAPRK